MESSAVEVVFACSSCGRPARFCEDLPRDRLYCCASCLVGHADPAGPAAQRKNTLSQIAEDALGIRIGSAGKGSSSFSALGAGPADECAAAVRILQDREPGVATALAGLLDSLSRPEVEEERRAEALELLAELGSHAAAPPQYCRVAVVRALYERIGALLGKSPDLAGAWEQNREALRLLLGG